jgi:hypothetical protein
LVKDTSIEGIAHLGRYAFSEIVNAVVAPVLFITRQIKPNQRHQVWACRLTAPRPSEEQASLLLKTVQLKTAQTLFTPQQDDFVFIPESAIVYWLQPHFLELLKSSRSLRTIAEVRQGLATADNTRFLRCFWEAYSPSMRWMPYAKGGGYCKWAGLEWLLVDWQMDGIRVRAFGKGRFQGTEFYFKQGLTYTLMARGSFSARVLNKSLFDVTGISMFSKGTVSIHYLIAFSAARAVSYLLRVTVQDTKFHAGYVCNLPLSKDSTSANLIETIGSLCIEFKRMIVSHNLVERNFENSIHKQNYLVPTILHSLEGLNEYIVCNSYQLDSHDVKAICDETGTPAGWYPLIANYDTLPTLPDNLELPPIPQELANHLYKHKRIMPESKELTRIKLNLRALYEAGPGAKNVEQEENNEVAEDSEGEEDIASGAYIPIPTETFLEELSVKMQIHPISIYWLLEELHAEGVRCKPEEQRMLEDRLSVLILRLLGYRWPKQIEAGEPVPAWAAHDGIVPLVSGAGKAMLGERLRERLRAEDGAIEAQQVESLLEELTGLNLEEWLRRRFFSRHISQFKYHPVAWHLASTPSKTASKGKKSRGGSTQHRPAFECFLYYHACSSNALARIRNEYVEPLLQIERSKIERNKTEASEGQLFSDDTVSAIASERIRELEEFIVKLRGIEEQGFACDELQKLLANEQLDRWRGDGYLPPLSLEEFIREEEAWHVDINDGVRVNIAPLQLAGVLASDVLKAVDARKAIADRVRWRSDERRWVREGKLPRCGWMDEQVPPSQKWDELEPQRMIEQQKLAQKRLLLEQGQHGDEADEVEAEVRP